ncbi:MAG: hypothetical protein KDK70_17820 [Myxococcales bacterium]|nr:hypothetical protein [Myxococcales bacterium]
MTQRHLTLLLAGLVLPSTLPSAAGCGDDGPPDTAATTTTTTTEPSSSSDGGVTVTSMGPGDGMTDIDDSSSSGGADGSSSGEASTGSTGDEGLEIAGHWFEELSPGAGVDHLIDEQRWDQLADFGDAIFHVEAYDNTARWVVAQGDASNEFFADLYSKFDWTWDGPDLYYCTSVFDAATAEDAIAGPSADPGDLAAGCGGFGWSLLMPVP